MISVFFVNLYFWTISNISSSTFAEPAFSRTEYKYDNWYKCAQITFPFSQKRPKSSVKKWKSASLGGLSLTCPHPPVDGHPSLHPGPLTINIEGVSWAPPWSLPPPSPPPHFPPFADFWLIWLWLFWKTRHQWSSFVVVAIHASIHYGEQCSLNNEHTMN